MADEPAGRTSLGVLHEILNNLGDSNTYLTVVDALEALLNVLGSGGIGQAVSDWLEAHPETTTTVQNGSITLLKLANDVKSAIDGKAASSDLQALASNLEALAQTGGVLESVGTSFIYEGTSNVKYIHVTVPLAVAAGDRIYFKEVTGSLSRQLFGYNGASNTMLKTLTDEEVYTFAASYDSLRVIYTNNEQTDYTYRFVLVKLDGESVSSVAYRTMLGLAESDAQIASNTAQISDLRTMVQNGESLNKFDGHLDNLSVGRVYDGVYQPSITTMKCTNLIPVKAGHKYFEYGGFLTDSHYTSFFDADGTFLSTIQFAELVSTYPYGNDKNYAEFTVPSGAAYIRVNFFANTDVSSFYLYDSTELGAWAKSRVLVLGDSISTDVYGGYKKWVTDLMDEGFFTPYYTENDSKHATGFVATYSGTDDFVTRLKAKTAADYSAFVLFGGVNDYIQSITFTTFTAAVDEFFSYLVANFAHARMCVLLPLMIESGKTANSAGKTLHEYVDYIREKCESYSIPTLNLTDDSGFMPFVPEFRDTWTLVPSGYETHDGVHPNEEWELRFLTPMVRQFLQGLM